MKFNLYGFNQEKAIELGLSNDALLILRWFVDFRDSGKMNVKYIEEENKHYYWVTYQKIIEDIPILVEEFNCKEDGNKEYKESKESRRLKNQKKKLRNIIDGNLSKVLCKRIERKCAGTFLYMTINEEVYKDLIGKTEIEDEKNSNGLIKGNEENQCHIIYENKETSIVKEAPMIMAVKTMVKINEKCNMDIVEETPMVIMEKDKLDMNGRFNVDIQRASNKIIDVKNNVNTNDIDKMNRDKKSIVDINVNSIVKMNKKSNMKKDEVITVEKSEKSNMVMSEIMSVEKVEKTPMALAKKVTTKITLLNNNSIKINKDIYSLVIDHLNQRCGSSYKSSTKKTKKLIKARINEGFEENDFIKVIDKKCEEWINTDFEKYLRPETLFGAKFEGYLNQKGGKVRNYGGFKQNIKTSKSKEFDFSSINAM